jgi:heme/copper-type cytochrome/quinol oxidase subunit 1
LGFLVIQKFIILILPGIWCLFQQLYLTYARRRIFGHEGMVFAMATIGILGFLVWAHHIVYRWVWM